MIFFSIFSVINKYNTGSSESCFHKPCYKTKNMEFSNVSWTISLEQYT